MKSARTAIAGELAGELPERIPSRFVTPSVPEVPVKICTPKVLAWANPKYDGMAVMLNAVLDSGAAGVAVMRDQRRVTLSAVAAAMVLPFAATNGVVT